MNSPLHITWEKGQDKSGNHVSVSLLTHLDHFELAAVHNLKAPDGTTKSSRVALIPCNQKKKLVLAKVTTNATYILHTLP